eukprot:GSA25T00007382001.1
MPLFRNPKIAAPGLLGNPNASVTELEALVGGHQGDVESGGGKQAKNGKKSASTSQETEVLEDEAEQGRIMNDDEKDKARDLNDSSP